MPFRFLLFGVLGGGVVLLAQDLKAPPRCTGPECAERMRVQESTPRRRSTRRAETRVDRYGYPKHRMRAERYRFSPPTPRHKAIERAEAFTPYAPSVRHSNRAERQRLQAARRSHRTLLRAEKYRPPTSAPSHHQKAERFALQAPKRKHRALAQAERQKPYSIRHSHRQLSELHRPPSKRLLHKPQKPERWTPPLTAPGHRQYAEKYRYRPPSTRHKTYAEKWAYSAPITKHSRSSERFRLGLPIPKHHKTPEKELYAMPKTRHRSTKQSACSPPPIPHPTERWTAIQSCLPPLLRHSQKHQAAACQVPPISHSQKSQTASCRPPKIRHRQGMQVATCPPPSVRHSQKPQTASCTPPPIRHSQSYQRASCGGPILAHRHPRDYDVPCDAQRRGVMTQTQRFAYDLRYLFTNHRKHCEVQSAYSGISIGEWVNTEAYGRVPVVAYKMGWRVYRFAHFYDKKGHYLKKPRIEKRKVWALYQIQVLVPQPAKGKSKKRRYVKGLPGIEGFAGMGDVALEPKWLSPEETKAIQIEKLVRKRQIAWLVRAYPEEQVRLPEWLKKYAGPKPEHLWPGVDYRLLELWQ